MKRGFRLALSIGIALLLSLFLFIGVAPSLITNAAPIHGNPPPQVLNATCSTNISGVVFDDSNGNKTQDNGEPGLPNVQVKVKDATTGQALGKIHTDANGKYV